MITSSGRIHCDQCAMDPEVIAVVNQHGAALCLACFQKTLAEPVTVEPGHQRIVVHFQAVQVRASGANA